MITECAFAKVNLGIDVPYLRDDGYHEVDMIMQSLELCDTVMTEENGADDISLSIVSDDPGIDVSSLPADGRNLCVRAAQLIMDQSNIKRGINICLIKRIPFEAGLGGGSADAAAVLRALNRLFSLGYSSEELREIGLGAGADVPFCVTGGTARLKGIGELLKPLSPCFSGVPVVLVRPSFGISTADIYHAIDEVSDPYHPDMDALEAAVLSGSIPAVSSAMSNMLETAAVERHPLIEDIKNEIKSLGAAGALMTGSGSTVFGLFEKQEQAWTAAHILSGRHLDWFVKATVTNTGA